MTTVIGQLLFTCCMLKYREEDILKVWHDIHPLIEEADQFKYEFTRRKGS